MTTSTQSRYLGRLGRALDWRFDRLQTEYLAGSAAARAQLAQLRRGLGKTAGSVPEIWEITIGAVPRSMQWDRDEPSFAEQAAHAALTLFALHQQSMSGPAHMPEVSFGQAVGRLARSDPDRGQAVTRRFMAVATATTVDEILQHVRGLVTQLRGRNEGFDYAGFADDILSLLYGSKDVRLVWGRDFYRNHQVTDKPETTDEAKE